MVISHSFGKSDSEHQDSPPSFTFLVDPQNCWGLWQTIHLWATSSFTSGDRFFSSSSNSWNISCWKRSVRLIKSNSLLFMELPKNTSNHLTLDMGTASLRSMFWRLITLSVKNLVLMSSLNFTSCSFPPFPCVLSLVHRERRPATPALLPVVLKVTVIVWGLWPAIHILNKYLTLNLEARSPLKKTKIQQQQKKHKSKQETKKTTPTKTNPKQKYYRQHLNLQLPYPKWNWIN